MTMDAETERLQTVLRREWWSNHGCATSARYGDDGEMQCASCGTDFLRMEFTALERQVEHTRLAAVARAAIDQRPPLPTNFSWCSICSAHREYREDCGNCNAGQWVSNDYTELNHWLYEHDRKLWMEWANRTNSKQRTLLERLFPGLRRRVEHK